MKKFFRILMRSGDKKPPPLPPKRNVPAHELAMKQLIARRRDEQARLVEENASNAAPPSGRTRVPAQAMPAQAVPAQGVPVDGGAVARADEAAKPAVRPPASAVAPSPAPAVPVDGGSGARSDGRPRSLPSEKNMPKLVGRGPQQEGYVPSHQLADISSGVEFKGAHSLADAGSIAGEYQAMTGARAKGGAERKRKKRPVKQPASGRAVAS